MKINDLFKKYWKTIKFPVIFLIIINILFIAYTYFKGISINLQFLSLGVFVLIINFLFFGYIGFVLAKENKSMKDSLWAGGLAGFILGGIISVITIIIFLIFPEKVLEEGFKVMQIKDPSVPFEFYKENYKWVFYIGEIWGIVRTSIQGFFLSWLGFMIFRKKAKTKP